EYPIHDGTRVVVCTHAQLGRRGFSTRIRGIWTKLGADEEKERPAFAIIIDEVAEYVREARREIDLAHRTGTKGEPDGSGGVILVRGRCPKFTRSGNCANCKLVKHGGVARFNRFGIRELRPPPAIELNADGERLRRPRNPLTVTEDDIRLGPKVRVAGTTFAAPVLAAWGQPHDGRARRVAAPSAVRR